MRAEGIVRQQLIFILEKRECFLQCVCRRTKINTIYSRTNRGIFLCKRKKKHSRSAGFVCLYREEQEERGGSHRESCCRGEGQVRLVPTASCRLLEGYVRGRGTPETTHLSIIHHPTGSNFQLSTQPRATNQNYKKQKCSKITKYLRKGALV